MAGQCYRLILTKVTDRMAKAWLPRCSSKRLVHGGKRERSESADPSNATDSWLCKRVCTPLCCDCWRQFYRITVQCTSQVDFSRHPRRETFHVRDLVFCLLESLRGNQNQVSNGTTFEHPDRVLLGGTPVKANVSLIGWQKLNECCLFSSRDSC